MEFGLVKYVLLAVFVIWVLVKFLDVFWWTPKRIEKHFLKQGIRGPPYWPLIGSLGELGKLYAQATPPPTPSQAHPYHPLLQYVFPHVHIWREQYGRTFLYWYGRSPRLQITDPELIREFTMNPRKFKQSIQHPIVYNLLGEGIVASGGATWAAQRKILSPYFFMESLKGLSAVVVSAAEEMMQRWSRLMGADELEMEVLGEFENISQLIIAKVLFGNDAEDGVAIVKLQAEQSTISSQSLKSLYIPGSRFLPTALNRRSTGLRRETVRKFNKIIDARNRRRQGPLDDGDSDDDDWLASMLSSNSMSRQQIIDECCTFMIAGSETTNLVLTYACFLLSIHTEWQDKARKEVRQVLQGSLPTMETISQLRVLNMIIHETLRLYTPLPFVMKTLNEEMKIGNITIPAGVGVEMPMVAVHHDPMQWGENFDQFDPNRFSQGASKASKHPMAFMPFMLGPRICIGMNFALIETRIILAVVLQNFAFVVSPTYKHELAFGLSMKPKYGTRLLFRKK